MTTVGGTMHEQVSLTRRRALKSGLAIAAAATTHTVLAAPERGIVGSIAPELDVSVWLDAGGNPGGDFKVEPQRNKLIVLKFWQNWCPGCHRHGLPALKTMSHALADNPNIAFAAVQTAFEGLNTNSVDKLEKIQNQYELAMPVGHADAATDGSHLPAVMMKYRTGGTPWFVVIAPGGEVLYDGFQL
ncbi:MAG: hypothetical protein AAF460_17505, partial [Pseudomonadota bacterium]